jgi:pimeloyl-ACP methyl ester carboxylesterase
MDSAQVTATFAEVNGIKIAYRVQGAGQPLVLVMGYRLSSAAWPPVFVEALARQFTVITLDNRGTGFSDKPIHGYAISNMARDIQGLLDELAISRIHLLGYSMGGAIAQEFVRQFPERVQSLMLCATMCGGTRATYAKPSVTRVMREIDGLSPEQIARRIWKVTYAPAYLERHEALAEDQTRREIAFPTPLHSADLQFQAFAEFDGSKALAQIACPTLVLTGDLDELIPPQNSAMMASLIPDVRLAIVPGGGHRVLWEATDTCIDLISGFLRLAPDNPIAIRSAEVSQERTSTASAILASWTELFTTLPLAFARAGFDSLAVFRQSIMVGSASRFGDGKPLVLVPQLLGSDISLFPLSMWLKALGYRPVTTGHFTSMEDSSSNRSLSRVIRDITRKVGRKAILIAHSSSMTQALAAAHGNRELVSDVIVFDAGNRPTTDGLRVHFLQSGWPPLNGLVELPRLLRSIGIELIEGIGWTGTPSSNALLAEGEGS